MFGRRYHNYGAGGRRRGRGNRGDPYFWILAFQLLSRINALPYKPPITLAIMAMLTGIHLGPGFFPELSLFIPTKIEDVCLMPSRIIWNFAYESKTLLLSSLYHVDDYHLYYNLSSMLVKGVSLELRLGSDIFLFIVMYALITTPIILVILSQLLVPYLGRSVMNSCHVGFSGILFCLKVLANHYGDDNRNQYMYGFSVPMKYSAWAELVLIYFMFPGSSFLGHLSGILSGMLFLAITKNGVVIRKVRNVFQSLKNFVLGFVDPEVYEQYRYQGYGQARAEPPRNQQQYEQPREEPVPTAEEMRQARLRRMREQWDR